MKRSVERRRCATVPVPLFLVFLSVSCGAPQLPSSPDSKYSTTLVSAQETPWLVEWESAHKTALRSLLDGGVVLVDYTGSALRLLNGCEVSGEYGFEEIPKDSTQEWIESEQDIYAKLPINAVKLAAEYRQGEYWLMEVVITGVREASVASVTKSSLSGRCSEATHYVGSVMTGAYRLVSRADRKGGLKADVHVAKAGATSASEAKLIRQDGSYDMCTQPETDNDSQECQAMLQLVLEPIGE